MENTTVETVNDSTSTETAAQEASVSVEAANDFELTLDDLMKDTGQIKDIIICKISASSRFFVE